MTDDGSGAPPARGRSIAFGHVGLHVSDLDRSRAFYGGIIGLAEVERFIRTDAYLRHVTGYPDVTLDIALFVEPASGVLLELLEYQGVERRPVDPATANPGTGHVCFEVDDVDAIHARAIGGGYGAVNEPVTPTSGRWIGGRSVYLVDPDGIRVELVQRARLAPGSTGAPASAPAGEPGPAVESEAVYLVEADFAPGAADRRVPYRAAHLLRIAQLKRAGAIIEAGAYLDSLSASVMLIRAASPEDARRIAEADIYVATGVWREIRVRPFGRVVGRATGA
ncbi:MAG: VOC family protein [Chloroflexi bacterium]|nr:VOC family protein [Chloroflexota bacterium]